MSSSEGVRFYSTPSHYDRMMIVQSTPIILKQRNQPNRECLYAWYPEPVSSTVQEPRDIYIHKGIDKDLIRQPTPIREVNTPSQTDPNVLQRYQQSITSSERDYHSTETLDEALRTPWALHYEIQRRAATPNFSCNSTEVSTTEAVPRRLKSAPPMRSLPSTTVLTIPEPRFVTPIIPVVTETVIQVRPKTRASSAKARLNTTYPSVNEQNYEDFKQQRREIKSAQGTRLSDPTEDQPRAIIQVYNDTLPHQEPAPIPPASPAYVYQKPPSRSSSAQSPSTPLIIKALRSTTEINPVPLNPHYVHRPGVISVKNSEKKAVVRDSSAPRKSSRHHRRHHQQCHEKHNEPLLALTPISRSIKIPFELDGIKLIYDPTLTIDDPSLNVTRYFVEGSLYLIKDQRFNVFENIDRTMIDKFNQTSSLPSRPKYYQTIPVEKFQIPKPAADVHYNASETYFYNTIPKRVHRYVIDPNFISENLNVNRMSLSKRPMTPAVAHSSLHDFHRRQNTPPTLYT